MSSDPELKVALANVMLRYNRLRAALRQVYKTATARGPINMSARLQEIEEVSGRALGRRKQ